MRPEKRAIRNLAKRMRELRLSKGYSQEELADRMGADRTYVSDLERQLRNPSLRTLAKLADALDTSIGGLCD
jgi:transcriptional regulator with XRE-family HTH domain